MLLCIVFCVLFLFLVLVSEVHISPDVILEHSVPSSCLVPSDSFSLSSDNVAKAIQTATNVTNAAVPEEQVKPQFLCYVCVKYLSIVSFLCKSCPLRAKGLWSPVVQTLK